MDDPSFYLEGIVREKDELKDFEGPLSLILMLLQKNKIEIREIRVSEILDQYLDYLAEMQKMDLEVTSEFVRMASYLLYLRRSGRWHRSLANPIGRVYCCIPVHRKRLLPQLRTILMSTGRLSC